MSIAVQTLVHSQHIETALMAAAGPRANVGIARALNRTGSPTRTAYLRSVKAILGLKSHRYAKASVNDILNRRTSTRRANAGRLNYSLAGFGEGLPAIYYQPKESPAGASIHWLGGRKVIPRSFYLSGRFPRRRRSSISDSVWRRKGQGRWNLDRPKGPGVPEGMIQPTPKQIWLGNARSRLPGHIIHELTAIIAGYA